jgi:hypothetical protein
VIVFTFLEHFITGYIHGHNTADLFQEIIDKGWKELLARGLVMFFVFILMFSFIELESVLGENKVYNLFFKRRE